MNVIPTIAQLGDAWFFTCLFGGAFAVLLATWWISDYGVDLAIRWWHRRQPRRHADPVTEGFEDLMIANRRFSQGAARPNDQVKFATARRPEDDCTERRKLIAIVGGRR